MSIITEKRMIDEYFTVQDIDSSGHFFKKVSRVKALSKSNEVEMELDVNFDIYPIEKNAEYRVLVVRSLGISSEQDQGKYRPEYQGQISEMDNFQYAMYGRVFKIIKDQKQVAVFASFGGLILKLSGQTEELDKFVDDQRIYLLMRKG